MGSEEMNDIRQALVSRIILFRSEKSVGDVEKKILILGYIISEIHWLHENVSEIINRQSPGIVILDLCTEDLTAGLELAHTIFYHYGSAVLVILDGVPPDDVMENISSHPYGIVLSPFRVFDLKVGIAAAVRMHQLNHDCVTSAETLMQASPAYYVAIGADGRIQTMNDAFLKALGYRLTQIVGRPMFDLLHNPEDRSLLDGILEKLEADSQVNHIELQCRAADGRSVTVVWNTRQATGPDGRTEYYYGLGIDVTDRKKIEEMIVDSEYKYRDIYESAPVGIFRSTKSGRFLNVNPYVVKMLGYDSADELLDFINQVGLGKGLYRNEQTRAQFLKKVEKWKGWLEYQVDFSKKDGRTITCRVLIRVLKKNHDDTIYEGFIEDITEHIQAKRERRKLESLLVQSQKMEGIGTLAGGIAHDLNNILSPIIAFTELARLNVPAEDQEYRYLTEVLNAALRARDLVKHILAFSRQSEIEKSPTNLNPLVKEAVNFLRASLGATIDIQLNLHLDEALVWADPSQIHQVVMNLCTNAAQAMKSSGGSLTVDLTELVIDETRTIPYIDLKKGRYIEIAFTDDGPGIPEKVMNRIFDPFYTTKERGKGTGLGLSVVHGIVKGMDGAISVFSEPGKGTVFRVYLPKFTDIRNVPDTPDCTIIHGSGRILLVDDEERIVMAGLLILERLGYEVRASTRSMEALEIFKQDPAAFDLVITDITMPKMTGLELARQLIHIRPDLPILLCTGFSDAVTPETMKEIGIRGVVMKPMIIKDLARVIHDTLVRDSEPDQLSPEVDR